MVIEWQRVAMMPMTMQVDSHQMKQMQTHMSTVIEWPRVALMPPMIQVDFHHLK